MMGLAGAVFALTRSLRNFELRVDPDGRRPTRRMSGDFYMQSGATLNYFGSFIVHSPTISVTIPEENGMLSDLAYCDMAASVIP